VLVAGEQKNKSVLGYSLLGLGSLAALSGDKAKAADYLRRLTETVGDSAPTDGPLQLSRMLQQGKVHLADGKFESALELFTRVQDKKKKNQLMIDASLGKAETELRMGDATAAAADARTALDVSTALQGGIPHSNRTGLSWLALGLALQNLGDHEHAHAAFDAAVVELANTVDADHPALLEARRHAATAQSQTH